MPCFHGTSPLGTSGHSSRPSTFGRMPAHTSTNGCPVISTFGSRTVVGDAGLLRARHQMIEQHAESTVGAGPEVGDRGGEIVGAVERFHDDAEFAEVVAPHVLEQFGVVLALDPDPARRGDSGPAVAGHRTRRRDALGGGRGASPVARV